MDPQLSPLAPRPLQARWLACMLLAGWLYSRPPYACAGAVLLPAAVWALERRGQASPLALLAWYLGVAAPVPLAVVDVGSGCAMGAALWLAYAMVCTACTREALHCASPWARVGWLLIPLSLPPLALVVVAPPLAGAGWWYPGAGVGGILLLGWLAAALVRALDSVTLRPIIAPLALSVVFNALAFIAPTPTGVHAVTLPVARPPTDLEGSIVASLRYAKMLRAQVPMGTLNSVTVLPENVLGPVSTGSIHVLNLPRGMTLVAGGFGSVPWADSQQKGVWVLPERVFYPAIEPIPFIEPHLHPHWSAIGRTAPIAGRAYTLLVCFEASASLPLYHLRYHTPVLLLGNGWWDRHGIMDIEVSLARAWARLDNAPLAIARGEPMP